MVRVTRNDQNVVDTKKAKKFLKSLNAAALAGVIVVTSTGYAKTVKADSVKDSSVTVQDDLVDFLDSKFTWEFDVNEEDYRSSESVDTAEESVFDEDAPMFEGFTDGGHDVAIPVSTSNNEPLVENVENETPIEENIEYSSDCYQLVGDIDPSLVDENYNGVAPKGYYGPEHIIKNYGDASNDEDVRERATMVWNAFRRANQEAGRLEIVDPSTNEEYTVEKIIDIIKYINGAYVATDGVDAKRMNDAWIDFMLVPLNHLYLIEDVNYKADSDVITEQDVVKHNNLLEYLDMGHLLMGDSPNGPMLQWLGDQIVKMYTTTNKEEAVKAGNEFFLAITALTEGNGYVINGVRYTIGDFRGVNDLMVLDTEVLVAQVIRNAKMESGYAFDKEYVGITRVNVSDTLRQYNALCAEDLVTEFKNNGVEVYEGVVTYDNGADLNIRNLGNVIQMRALDAALSNGQYGIEYYQDSYLEHYDEYNKEKNGGTYEDVLESDYVYKKSK